MPRRIARGGVDEVFEGQFRSLCDDTRALYSINAILAGSGSSVPGSSQSHPAISAGVRGILADWLAEVAQEYQLTRDTFHLAIAIVDRYLAVVRDVENPHNLNPRLRTAPPLPCRTIAFRCGFWLICHFCWVMDGYRSKSYPSPRYNSLESLRCTWHRSWRRCSLHHSRILR